MCQYPNSCYRAIVQTSTDSVLKILIWFPCLRELFTFLYQETLVTAHFLLAEGNWPAKVCRRGRQFASGGHMHRVTKHSSNHSRELEGSIAPQFSSHCSPSCPRILSFRAVDCIGWRRHHIVTYLSLLINIPRAPVRQPGDPCGCSLKWCSLGLIVFSLRTRPSWRKSGTVLGTVLTEFHTARITCVVIFFSHGCPFRWCGNLAPSQLVCGSVVEGAVTRWHLKETGLCVVSEGLNFRVRFPGWHVATVFS